jgi:protein phosphatase
MKIRLKAVAHTHPGRVRKINEDSVFTFVRPREKGKPLGLLVVADGIGGHKAGDIASKIAIDSIHEHLMWFLDRDQKDDTRPVANDLNDVIDNADGENFLETRMRVAIEAANQKIIKYARENPVKAGNMGSTITSLLLWRSHMILAHVGDSRAYLYRDSELTQLSEDHSFVGEMVRKGEYSSDALYDHPRRNVITRALGQFSDLQIDLWTGESKPGDRYLLCSDGLWEMVRDPVLKEQLSNKDDLDKIAENLIEAANNNGGSDNISVVLGEVTS